MKYPNRICIYPKDIMLITGKSERYSRKLIHKIKEKLKKEDHQVLTITEFCSYLGITIEEAYNIIL